MLSPKLKLSYDELNATLLVLKDRLRKYYGGIADAEASASVQDATIPRSAYLELAEILKHEVVQLELTIADFEMEMASLKAELEM